jgi:hypothetical protein
MKYFTEIYVACNTKNLKYIYFAMYGRNPGIIDGNYKYSKVYKQ